MSYSICDDLFIQELSEREYYLSHYSTPDLFAFFEGITAEIYELNFNYKGNNNIAFFHNDPNQGVRIVFVIIH